MNVTFLLHLNVEDVSQIPALAVDIQDDLIGAGHDVISVEPWSRPTQNLASPLVPLPSPPTEPLTPPLL